MLELKRGLEMRVLIYDQEICEGDVNLLRAAMQLMNINKAGKFENQRKSQENGF